MCVVGFRSLPSQRIPSLLPNASVSNTTTTAMSTSRLNNAGTGQFDDRSQKRRILTIDDNRSIHEDYRKVLLQRDSNDQLDATEALLFGDDNVTSPNSVDYQYEIDSAFQGQQGFELVKQSLADNNPYSAAFIDVRMPPGWDGVETAQRIWEIAPDLPIVLCTAYSDHSWDEISQRLDRTDLLLILKKPFDPVELRQIAAAQTTRWQLNQLASRKQEQLEEMVQERTREIAMTRDLVFVTLAGLAESRDSDTGEHLNRIEGYTRLLTEQLAATAAERHQLDRRTIETICRSSVLHDIGKVGVPDSILLKPGRLTKEEFEIMKQHAEIGARALENASTKAGCNNFLKTATEIARYHHERFDGTGYPHGLSGEAIPLSARIVAVADVFDALTSKRVYKNAMSPFEARMIICSEAGSHFDPEVVKAFNDCWDGFLQMVNKCNPQEITEIEEAETIVSGGGKPAVNAAAVSSAAT